MTDVIAGGLLGTASSTLFYLYQERRYRNHKHGERNDSLAILPTVTAESVQLNLGFTW